MEKVKAFLLGICLVFAGAYTIDAHTVDDESKQEIREAVAATYTAEIGVEETDGPNDGPQIRKYLRTTNISFAAPWCAAFVSYCYTVNGVENPRSAWSPDYFRRKVIDIKHNQPLRADVFGVWYNNLGRIAHIGFIDHWPRDGDWFVSVEGNTNVNGGREGTGVYKKRRPKRTAYQVARYI